MNKENASKIWKLIQETGDFLKGKLPDHPNHPKGRNPYAHVALEVKNYYRDLKQFTCQNNNFKYLNISNDYGISYLCNKEKNSFKKTSFPPFLKISTPILLASILADTTMPFSAMKPSLSFLQEINVIDISNKIKFFSVLIF